MKLFIKANIASLAASLCDFIITITLKEVFDADPVLASIIGTVMGGCINFYIGRYWVFKVHHLNIYHQTKKYFITWAGNLLLNASGVYFLIHYAELNYILTKVIISVLVAVFYNYPLQKKYVFKNN